MQNALLYTFSTIAQTLAGAIALLGAFVLYRLQSWDELIDILKGRLWSALPLPEAQIVKLTGKSRLEVQINASPETILGLADFLLEQDNLARYRIDKRDMDEIRLHEDSLASALRPKRAFLYVFHISLIITMITMVGSPFFGPREMLDPSTVVDP